MQHFYAFYESILFFYEPKCYRLLFSFYIQKNVIFTVSIFKFSYTLKPKIFRLVRKITLLDIFNFFMVKHLLLTLKLKNVSQ